VEGANIDHDTLQKVWVIVFSNLKLERTKEIVNIFISVPFNAKGAF
jgi:hypothetical protein